MYRSPSQNADGQLFTEGSQVRVQPRRQSFTEFLYSGPTQAFAKQYHTWTPQQNARRWPAFVPDRAQGLKQGNDRRRFGTEDALSPKNPVTTLGDHSGAVRCSTQRYDASGSV